MPPVVTVHVWAVRTGAIPAALVRMARGAGDVRRTDGVRFVKLLGTSGAGFTVRDADLRHWVLLTSWRDETAAARADDLATVVRWDRIADERWRADLRPIASRGRWSRKEPFGDPAPEQSAGPVAALTRARLTARRAATFWRAVPPVADALRDAPGRIIGFGVGEAPVGYQGTFSVWESAETLRRYAYESAAHTEVIRRTAETGWYAEELFARFAVVRARGTLHGASLDLDGP